MNSQPSGHVINSQQVANFFASQTGGQTSRDRVSCRDLLDALENDNLVKYVIWPTEIRDDNSTQPSQVSTNISSICHIDLPYEVFGESVQC